MKTHLSLMTLLLVVACGQDSTATQTADEADGSVATPGEVQLFARLSGVDGEVVDDAWLCARATCYEVVDGNSHLAAQPETEWELIALQDDMVPTCFQFRTDDRSEVLDLVQFTKDDLTQLAQEVGVERQTDLVTVLQWVESDVGGIVPALSDTSADGPFFLDADYRLISGAIALPAGGAFVAFTNVNPGPRQLDLGDCDEGRMFWGQAHDGRIDFEARAGGLVSLFDVDCSQM